MPSTVILFYKESDGTVPVFEWLRALQKQDRQGFANCVDKLKRLRAMGFELRRPDADLLRDGIYELRARHRKVNFRILYFFHGRNVAILNHALTKEDKIPKTDLAKAIRRKRQFESNPQAHSAPGSFLDE